MNKIGTLSFLKFQKLSECEIWATWKTFSSNKILISFINPL